jgi:hypothetical protein
MNRRASTKRELTKSEESSTNCSLALIFFRQTATGIMEHTVNSHPLSLEQVMKKNGTEEQSGLISS